MAEAVGLTLAVLPILISAAEHYREGVDSLQTLNPKIGDDRILEFYEEVAFELYLLRNSIKKLVKDLPGFSERYKKELLKSVQPERWSDESLSSALRRKLGDIDYPIFEMTLRRLLLSLNALVSGNQQLLSSSEILDESIFCVRLSMFRENIMAGNTLSTLCKRVQFTASQNKRSKYLCKITKYNERLQRLLEGASDIEYAELDRKIWSLSPNFRATACTIHDALCRTWICSCDAPHNDKLFDAKLCLNNDMSSKDSFEFSFDILFATRGESDGICMEHHTWQESVIHTAPKRKVTSETSNKEVTSICEVVQIARGHGICLQMVLNDQKLWQIRPQSKRFNHGRNITLESILHGSTQLRLRDKRVLAVTLAKAVLQLSEGPWLRKKWSPAQISFFETAQNIINFERPYLSAQFKEESKDDADSVLDAQSIHASPSLLSLGKLLLEIDRGRLIEPSPLDLTDGKFPNANTELTATMRFFKEASEDFYIEYKRAVKACLEPTFLHLDQRVGLDDEEVRQLVLGALVATLEENDHLRSLILEAKLKCGRLLSEMDTYQRATVRLLSILPNLQTLHLQPGEIYFAHAPSAQISSLHICISQGKSVDMQTLEKLLRNKFLRILSMTTNQSWARQTEAIEEKIPKSLNSTSSITHLVVSSSICSATGMQTILRAPKALISLHYHYHGQQMQIRNAITPSDFPTPLLAQQSSLEELAVYAQSHQHISLQHPAGHVMKSMRDFIALKRLGLPAWWMVHPGLEYREGQCADALSSAKIVEMLPPNLEVLQIQLEEVRLHCRNQVPFEHISRIDNVVERYGMLLRWLREIALWKQVYVHGLKEVVVWSSGPEMPHEWKMRLESGIEGTFTEQGVGIKFIVCRPNSSMLFGTTTAF
ncbi:hypothetical protein CNMCM7691_008305 [Aspergillus felis]|uniref:DUF7580 domain-containing protein n=1 Tax=Aspergillus felis TaxID=1287682 RepID=A0A8H6QW70_9EURO|nr:hypothetical protein CNMCM7691_008305 [Aspergillus felis]